MSQPECSRPLSQEKTKEKLGSVRLLLSRSPAMMDIPKKRLATGCLTICGLSACFYDLLLIRHHLHAGAFGEAASVTAVALMHALLTFLSYEFDCHLRYPKTEVKNELVKAPLTRQRQYLGYYVAVLFYCFPMILGKCYPQAPPVPPLRNPIWRLTKCNRYALTSFLGHLANQPFVAFRLADTASCDMYLVVYCVHPPFDLSYVDYLDVCDRRLGLSYTVSCHRYSR